MTDLDRMLSESLKETGNSYSPSNAVAARDEFVSRRRRRFVWQLSGGLALAGAAVAAALFFASAEPLQKEKLEPGPFEPAALNLLTSFEVGTEPLAIGAGKDMRLWIASREGGSVSRINLTTGAVEEIALPGANEIVVGAENVWVSGEEGNYLRINEAKPRQILDGDLVEENDGGQLIDLAVGGDAQGAAWAVDDAGCVYELTTPEVITCEPGNFATDVATDTDETWLLNSDVGRAWLLNADPGVTEGRPGDEFEGLPRSEYGDMTMTENKLWVSGGGTIATVDLETGAMEEIEVDGDYADLAVGPDTVWALAGWGDNDPRSRVYELSHELEIIGVSDIIRGEPSDLVADPNGVWITVRYENEVIYLSRGETAPPAPDLQPAPDEPTSKHGDVVMVFAKDGDIWAAYADGTIGALTKTRAEEAHPVFMENIFSNDAPAVLFDRVEQGQPSRLYWIDLATMEEHSMVDGRAPASENTNRAAWLGNSASVPWVAVGELFSDEPTELTIKDENDEPVQLSQLAWDRDGRFVYGLTSDGRIASIDSTGELGEVYATADTGYRYAAVSMGGSMDSATVLRRRNSGGPLELGELTDWATGTPTYRGITEIPAPPSGAFVFEVTVTPADGLSAAENEDGMVTWGSLDAAAWVVSDGVAGWLVDEERVTKLPWEIHRGADVNEERDLN